MSIRSLRRAELSGRELSIAEKKQLALSYHAVGQHRLFASLMRRLMAAAPGDFEPPFLLARHLGSDADNWPEAIPLFRRAAALRRNSQTLAYLANALEANGPGAEAITLYLEAQRLNPCETVALAGLARMGRVEAAPILACRPRDPVLLGELAKLLQGAGRTAEAASALETAEAIAPRDASIAYRLYRIYLAAGQKEKAESALRRHNELRSIYGSR